MRVVIQEYNRVHPVTEARERIDIPDDDLPEGWRGDLALLYMLRGTRPYSGAMER